MRTCARSAVPCVALAPARSCCPPLITCSPTAQRGAGAAVPARSGPCGAAPRSPAESEHPHAHPTAARARRGPVGEQGWGGGRDGGAGQRSGERTERRDRGRDGRRDAGGGVSVTGGRREGVGRWGCIPAGLQRRGKSPSGPRQLAAQPWTQGAWPGHLLRWSRAGMSASRGTWPGP